MNTWTLSEPNIQSALRKNNNGICAMHNCNHVLSNPPSYGYGGLKICDACRKPIDKMRSEFDLDMMRQILNGIQEITKK